ncbi:carbohydrate-binding protein [Streptomyces sp. CB03234]|uniref:carbohydrate-binding protein n=1 Tax=Streptomyces sp. (strain CB03234) TaxID=1703937 RepID=UPI00093B8790|nr:carbohydrate-binding protein [Streptomyces sp. CB03234]OKJ99454.1 carbohydrate-binding protein [Streptomyces sp. CB03234]
MAAGNNGNGAGTPEDDDPFGYLYADGQAAGAQAPRQGGGYGYPGPAAQPGVPRTSYNQVRAVGERQYGQVPQQQYQQQYAQPSPQYAAPETYPGGGGDRTRPVPQAQPPQRGGGGRSGGPNTKGLLIGALAVVAVVVTGITVAVLTNSGSDGKGDPTAGQSAPATSVQESPTAKPSKSAEEPVELPKQDAATLQLGGPATLGKDVKGAKGADGAYVMFNGTGGSASWTVEVPKDGDYTLFLTYGVPGKDAKTSLSINGEQPRKINMSNFARAAEGDWEKGWTKTYSWVTLKKGVNTMKMSCEEGNQCEAYLDQVWLKEGHVSG